MESSAKDENTIGSNGGQTGAGGEPTLGQIEQAVREGCAPASFAGKIARAGTDQVDLLVVVDRSGSMAEEIAKLARELPKIAQSLTSGDLDGDGKKDILPVQSLRVGITSNDLGILAPNIPRCSNGTGDGGHLYETTSGKPYFEYTAGDPLAAFDELKELFVGIAADGCGFEQPFEATLAALTGEPAYADESDHWPKPDNGDFVRERSVLAVLLLTDEDDCSMLPPQTMADPATSDSRFANEGLNVRCALHKDDATLLRSVDDFVSRLKALREGVAPRVVFGAFAGAPAGTTKTPADLLADPAMQVRPDGPVDDNTTWLVPACETPDGRAAPAWRITRAAAAFGEFGIVQSICDADLSTRVERTFEKVASSFEPLPACD